MSNIIAWIRRLLAEEPAAVAWALGGGIALLGAYVFHWDHAWQAAAATIVTALAALYSALRARPAHIQAALGILLTLMAAAGTFGFHPSARLEAMILAGASVVLGLLFRQAVTPVALARKRAAAAVRQAQPEPSRYLVKPQGSL
jgi:uncharacterized membrane protein YgaE (UPF0421/DUF939 family)